VAGGYPAPGEQQAPYPEYQAWHPQGAPGGYAGPPGYGEAINGGDYAYVIHDPDAMAPAPSQPRMRERGQGLGAWSPANAGQPAGAGGTARPGKPADAAGTPPVVRAITAGAADTRWQAAAASPPDAASSAAATAPLAPAATPPVPAATAGTEAASGDARPAEAVAQASTTATGRAGDNARAESPPDLDPAMIYGPDDPAYGPPGPDWYKRREQGTSWAEEGDKDPDEGEPASVRGPFEPLRPGERDGSGAGEYRPADDELSLDGLSLDGEDDAPYPDMSAYEALDDELPDLLDFGTPSDPEAGTLGQIKDLYETAESISPAGLDRHFDQLLERQRQLISEYFKESGGVIPPEPVLPTTPATPPADEAQPASATPLGFDTAASLASLRGDLRSAQ
jgi:hypothetical protein